MRKRRNTDNQTPKLSGLERIGEILELPKETLLDMPRIEIIGNRELLVENYKGILEYSDDTVKLNAGRFIISIAGRALQIKSMTHDEILVCGFIARIEFTS